MWRVDSLEKTLMREGQGAGGEGDDREWDDWMASPTRWTWVWVNSGSWWWTGRPGVLRFMGLQRVGHNWMTKLILFAVVVAPIYITIKSIQVFLFCHILSNICYFWLFLVFDDSHSENGENDNSFCFWFAFLWWLLISNICPCACWSPLCLWENVCSYILSFFNWVICLHVWLVWAA